MHQTFRPDQQHLASLIKRLDVILAELDRAQLAMPAIDIASAIVKLQRHCAPQAQSVAVMRSTA